MSEDAGTGAEGTPEGAADGGAESGDITPPAANQWWQFTDQAAAESWANDLVTKRIARHKKTAVDPVVQERDTLKAEVEQLRPLREATQTDTERWESKLNAQTQQIDELLAYRSKNERDNLVRQIAGEEGLPASFLGRVSGDDEDAIREDIKSVLDALSEGGFNNTGKKTPPQKNPKPAGNGGGSVGSGGGSDSDEPDDAAQVASILEAAKKQRGFGGLVTPRR